MKVLSLKVDSFNFICGQSKIFIHMFVQKNMDLSPTSRFNEISGDHKRNLENS